MNCKHARTRMLEELGNDRSRDAEALRGHLKSCAACAAFERDLREKTARMFSGAGPITPPETVWHYIKEAIEAEEAVSAPVRRYRPSFAQRLRELVLYRIPAHAPRYAFGAILTAFVAVVVFMNSPLHRSMTARAYLSEQGMYLASLSAPANGASERELDMGTAIEEYLF